jgi:hypothetical protein
VSCVGGASRAAACSWFSVLRPSSTFTSNKASGGKDWRGDRQRRPRRHRVGDGDRLHFTGNTAGFHGNTIDGGDSGGGTAAVAEDVFDGSCDQAGGTWTDGGYNAGSDGSCFNGGTGNVTQLGAGPGLAGQQRRADADHRAADEQPGDRDHPRSHHHQLGRQPGAVVPGHRPARLPERRLGRV